jgi:hypothetical protein
MSFFPPNPQVRTHDLRWRFDFFGRPSKYGQWNRPGTTPETQAWCQNKEGLVRASIEGKNMVTKEIETLAECDGHDFVNFQWMAAAKMKPFFKGTANVAHFLVGLKIITRDSAVEVYPNGEVRKNERTEKNVQYATFGK